jgi:hypothetical protein
MMVLPVAAPRRVEESECVLVLGDEILEVAVVEHEETIFLLDLP